jgi:HpcH/HpaI aldolase/citrate lyase family
MRARTKISLLAAGVFAATAAVSLSTTTTALGQAPDVPSWLWPLNNETVGQVWSFNTVKQKMRKGQTIYATRLTSNTAANGAPGSDLANYCTIASTPGNDFVWTDMVHSGLEFSYTWKMWATLPSCTTAAAHLVGAEIFYAKRVNFVTKAYFRPPDPGADLLAIKEMARATDGGAMVIMIEAENGAQAQQIVQRAYYPPVGARDLGPGQYNLVYPSVSNYVGTYNANLTVFVNISTILGVSNASEIAGTYGIHGVFLDTANLESESGYAVGSPDFTMLQNAVVQAFRAAGKYVCIPTWNTTATDQTKADTLTCTL